MQELVVSLRSKGRTAFTLVTQNTGKTGLPSYADIVCSQENGLGAIDPKHDYHRANEETIAWDPEVFKADVYIRTLLHKGKAGIAPTRYLQELYGEISGVKVAIFNAHMINSSNPPVGVVPPFLRLRQRWWNKEARIIRRRRRHAWKLGYQVFINGDLNRLDDIRFAAFEVVVVRKLLDRMFYTLGPFIVMKKEQLPKVGTGKVTHHGIRALFVVKP